MTARKRTDNARTSQSPPTPTSPVVNQAGGYQSAQDAQALAVANSMAAMSEQGKAQLQALKSQACQYADAFSDAASDILVSTQAQAWQLTAEKTAAKLGAYSPVDVSNVFSAFSLDAADVHSHLRGIAEPAALMEGKANAGV